MSAASHVTGLAVSRGGHILVGLPTGTLAFGLTPEEMRGLAARLVETAEVVEIEAASAASAALARAGGLS